MPTPKAIVYTPMYGPLTEVLSVKSANKERREVGRLNDGKIKIANITSKAIGLFRKIEEEMRRRAVEMLPIINAYFFPMNLVMNPPIIAAIITIIIATRMNIVTPPLGFTESILPIVNLMFNTVNNLGKTKANPSIIANPIHIGKRIDVDLNSDNDSLISVFLLSFTFNKRDIINAENMKTKLIKYETSLKSNIIPEVRKPIR